MMALLFTAVGSTPPAFMLKDEVVMMVFTVAGWLLFGWFWNKLELFHSTKTAGAKLAGISVTGTEECATTAEADHLEGILTKARGFLVSVAASCFPRFYQEEQQDQTALGRRVSFSAEVKENDGATASERSTARRRRRQEWNHLLESYGVLGASPGAWTSDPVGHQEEEAKPPKLQEDVFYQHGGVSLCHIGGAEEDEQQAWTLLDGDFEYEEEVRSKIRSRGC